MTLLPSSPALPMTLALLPLPLRIRILVVYSFCETLPARIGTPAILAPNRQ